MDQCYGCKINHPSQRHHECLEVLEDNFFCDHYYHLMKRLITPHFIPSIQYLLINHRLPLDDLKVWTVAETLLYELKSVKKTCAELSDVYKNLTGQDLVKIGQLQTVTDCYTGAGTNC